LTYRLNPPPGWPPVPAGFVPPPGWQPDPSWPPAPPGWQLWVPDGTPPPDGPPAPAAWPAPFPAAPRQAAPYQAAPYQAAPYSAVPYSAVPGVRYDRAGRPVQGTSGFAIAAFVLGLLGGAVLSVIFGIIALVKLRTRPQRGKGLAIAGLCLSGVWIAALVGLAVYNAAGASQRSDTGQITKNGSLGVFSLVTGDCFQHPNGNQPASSLSEVTAVSCATPHNAQVIAQLPVSGSAYPGIAAFQAQEHEGCRAALANDVDQSKVTPTTELIWTYPKEKAWSDGDRMINCELVDSTADLTTSLLK
jgi:hypothetical protein